jgi:hypothetical protein
MPNAMKGRMTIDAVLRRLQASLPVILHSIIQHHSAFGNRQSAITCRLTVPTALDNMRAGD